MVVAGIPKTIDNDIDVRHYHFIYFSFIYAWLEFLCAFYVFADVELWLSSLCFVYP